MALWRGEPVAFCATLTLIGQKNRWRISRIVTLPDYQGIGIGMTVAEVDDMYRVMAIANYEDRFVIPSTHREYAENTFNVRGGCGFSFGNGCSEGMTETSLFGSEKKRTIPIKAEV